MTTEQLLFSLLRSIIDNKNIDLLERSFSADMLDETLRLARAHNIAHLFADAARKNGLVSDKQQDIAFEDCILLAMYEDARRTYDIDRIKALFTEEKIAFLPLKGTVLRQYYPETWMRNCCDTDILLRSEDLERAIDLLSKRFQYTVIRRGNHDVSMALGKSLVELHFDLIEAGRAKQATDVLKDVWDSAIPNGSDNEYRMPDELFYFYHIAHMAKHMTNAGCGIRNFIDVWVLNHCIDFDKEKCRQLFEKSGLATFADAVEHLSEVWFSDAEHTPLTRELETFVLNCGAFGNIENRVALAQVKLEGKTAYFIYRLFPPLRSMKDLYPLLDTCPFLLPVFWLVRLADAVFNKPRRSKIGRELRVNRRVDDQKTDSVKRLLKNLDL